MENTNETESPQVSNTEIIEPPLSEESKKLLTIKEKIILFITIYYRGLCIIAIPLLFLPVVIPHAKNYHWCAFALLVMAGFWVSECLPLPVTAFIPVIVFPLVGVMNGEAVANCYVNDTIIMFFGSLILASAVEQSGLHKRIALFFIRLIGYSHYRLLFTMCFVTMFISMWITNTAATTMMVPILFALLKVFEEQKLIVMYETNADGDEFASDITTCYFCAATFSATIGGIGTLVGTGTNLVFKGLMETTYPKAPELLSFPKFSAFAVPYMLIMEAFLYFSLCLLYLGLFRPNSKAAKSAHITPEGKAAAKAAVEKDSKALGRFTFWEAMVTILFSTAMIMFFSRSPTIFVGWADLITQGMGLGEKQYIKDSACAMLFCFGMLMLPRNLAFFKNCSAKYHEQLPGRIPSVLDWRKMDATLPYSFMFLLGGGFALSTAANEKNSNLNEQIGSFLAKMRDLPNPLIVLIIIIFTVLITNLASNVAVASVVVPIGMNLGEQLNHNPLLFNIAAGYSASYCFMLPVGTPGNLIVQSAAKIPTKKMIIAGAMPTLTTILITWAAIMVWAPVIWPGINDAQLPEWAKKATEGAGT